MGLLLEVLDFDVKNHVAFNPVVVKGGAFAWVQIFESDGHVFHFFGNGVCLKGVAIALVNFESMVNRGGNLNPKLHVLIKVAHFLFLN